MSEEELKRAFFALALLKEGSGETSADWLELALEEPPGSETRLFCIRQAERLETTKRGRGRPKKSGGGPPSEDWSVLVDMSLLAKRTGETQARKLARIALDKAIASGDYSITTTSYQTIVERLAARYRKEARDKERMEK